MDWDLCASSPSFVFSCLCFRFSFSVLFVSSFSWLWIHQLLLWIMFPWSNDREGKEESESIEGNSITLWLPTSFVPMLFFSYLSPSHFFLFFRACCVCSFLLIGARFSSHLKLLEVPAKLENILCLLVPTELYDSFLFSFALLSLFVHSLLRSSSYLFSYLPIVLLNFSTNILFSTTLQWPQTFSCASLGHLPSRLISIFPQVRHHSCYISSFFLIASVEVTHGSTRNRETCSMVRFPFWEWAPPKSSRTAFSDSACSNTMNEKETSGGSRARSNLEILFASFTVMLFLIR